MIKGITVILTAAAALSSAAFGGGFGREATGGAGGLTVTVTTAEALQYYVDRPDDEPYIILVQGTIDLEPLYRQRIRMRSNKTIRGIVGTTPTLIGQISFRDDATNIVIERLTITNPFGYGEGDGLNIRDRVSNLRVTRCTIYDCPDGLIDITSESDNITVSWCKFYFTDAFTQLGHGNRVSLIGAGDDSIEDDGKLHVTFHHNWFGPNCRQRIPSVRFGRVHLYNNLYDCPNNMYGVISRIRAECRIENNYYRNISNPYDVYAVGGEAPEDRGKIAASGNLFENCFGTIHAGTDEVFVPPYDYVLDGTFRVPDIVRLGAGADGMEIIPHWYYAYYGDFNRSGTVDMDDILTLAHYWLAVENIDNVDYDGDGIVNKNEFSLFARNWLAESDFFDTPSPPQNAWALGRNGQVTLTWNPSPELNVLGYEVYRTAASGSDYVRLNETLLPQAGYVDTAVVNGTMYYYAVRAVADGGSSALSVEACAEPAAGNPTLTLQENAVGFCGIDGVVDTGTYGGFTGAGYCDTLAAVGMGINWRVNIQTAGSYSFRWRFANASGNRPARLLLNGTQIIAGLPFMGTGGWENWNTVSLSYQLTPGLYDIRLEATGAEGLANIDYLRIVGAAPEAAVCP